MGDQLRKLTEHDRAHLRQLLAEGNVPWGWEPLGNHRVVIRDNDGHDIATFTPAHETLPNLIVAAVSALPALLDENDRLTIADEEHREVTSALRWDLATLIETVRAELTGLVQTRSDDARRAATRLAAACNQAGKTDHG